MKYMIHKTCYYLPEFTIQILDISLPLGKRNNRKSGNCLFVLPQFKYWHLWPAIVGNNNYIIQHVIDLTVQITQILVKKFVNRHRPRRRSEYTCEVVKWLFDNKIVDNQFRRRQAIIAIASATNTSPRPRTARDELWRWHHFFHVQTTPARCNGSVHLVVAKYWPRMGYPSTPVILNLFDHAAHWSQRIFRRGALYALVGWTCHINNILNVNR